MKPYYYDPRSKSYKEFRDYVIDTVNKKVIINVSQDEFSWSNDGSGTLIFTLGVGFKKIRLKGFVRDFRMNIIQSINPRGVQKIRGLIKYDGLLIKPLKMAYDGRSYSIAGIVKAPASHKGEFVYIMIYHDGTVKIYLHSGVETLHIHLKTQVKR